MQIPVLGKWPLTAVQWLVLGVLVGNIALFGCFTSMMWDKKSNNVGTDILFDKRLHSMSVMVLDDERIAILAPRNVGGQWRDMATIYRFRKESYEAVKADIAKVRIHESLDLDYKRKDIVGHQSSFVIELKNGQKITPDYLDATMTTRSDQEVVFDDPRLSFERTILGNRKYTKDTSWLWKLPLTPVTLVADAATTVAVVGGVVVAAGVAVVASPFVLLANLAHHDPVPVAKTVPAPAAGSVQAPAEEKK